MTQRVLLIAGVMFLVGNSALQAQVGITATKDHIDFQIGTELVGRYQIDAKWAKPILWPLKAPGGIDITRDWPMKKKTPDEKGDHPHQKSAWFCHGDVIPEGLDLKVKSSDKRVKGVDFWSEAAGHGRIVCTHVGEAKTDRAKGSITTKNEWRTADGTKIMDETRTLRLYDFGKARLLVFDIDLHASVYPITFGDTKEGAMGVRVHEQINEKVGKGKLENAEGKVSMKECWGIRSAWCDYSGTLSGAKVGITLLDDPKNPHPAVWHSRDYGLMAANPFGRSKSGFSAVKGKDDLVRLAKGEHLQLRYGILLHTGDARDGRVDDYFFRFVRLRDAP
jgi:hypothetical protein